MELRLAFDDLDPPQGRVTPADTEPSAAIQDIPFTGWLGLLRAIDEALAHPSPPPATKPLTRARRTITVAAITMAAAVLLGACTGSSKPHAVGPETPVATASQTAGAGSLDTGALLVSAATSSGDATPNGAPFKNVTPGVPALTGSPADTWYTPTRPDAGASPPATTPGESCQTSRPPASCSPTTAPAASDPSVSAEPDVITSPGDSCTAAAGFGEAGAAGVESNTCRYRAASAAGYQTSGGWKLWIDRAGTTRYFSSSNDPACSAIGLIQPGDLVTVQAGWSGPSDVIHVGPAFHC